MSKREWRRWAPLLIGLWLLAGVVEFGYDVYGAGFWGGVVFVVTLALLGLIAYRSVG